MLKKPVVKVSPAFSKAAGVQGAEPLVAHLSARNTPKPPQAVKEKPGNGRQPRCRTERNEQAAVASLAAGRNGMNRQRAPASLPDGTE